MSFASARVLTPPPDDAEERVRFPVAKTCLGDEIFSGTTAQQLRAVLDEVDVDQCDADGENAFFIADLAQIYRQYMQWRRELPHIIPFYAVKCNPEPMVLQLLAALGTGFDCASNGEIQTILDHGVQPSRIIYANPCKASSFVRRAASQNIGLTTFDNFDELDKMKRYHPTCKLVLRVLTDDSKSVCQLGIKFGAPLKDAPRLLARAKELDLDVVGVSFHVGSGCTDPEAFRDAVLRARRAFDMGAELGYQFDLLDVGGGFEHDNFAAIAAVLRSAIADYFPDEQFAPGGSRVAGLPNGLRIIAEPGRYFVQRAFSLATNIIARRVSDAHEDVAGGEAKPEAMYYQNDGTYGAFNCIIFDHQHVQPKVLTLDRAFVYRDDLPAPGVAPGTRAGDLWPCSVWGPTCDSMDCILRLTHLPRTLNVGDWLVYEGMGAYTLCAASNFNGLEAARVRYTLGADTTGDGAPEVVLARLRAAGMAVDAMDS
ncbi:ornithine decarboxylase [Malassezia obtusa]|uniref:ornithine decarboxylase n=1 Tax=Malassezia obtusa TaxID=76774 RepID=A0AAF0ITJ8_9BASI|nr:ornithine decarboxylase [Malassezia obtusa]